MENKISKYLSDIRKGAGGIGLWRRGGEGTDY